MGVRTRWWSALALLTGCSAAPPPIDDAISPPETIDVTPETSRAPSSGWRYHPREAAEVLNGIELPDGRWLLVTELGERWLTDGPARRASGEEVIPLGAEAAVHRAGEPLEHVVPWRPHQRPTTSTHPSHGADWLFVGESGRSYFAAEPLGPLTPGPTAPRSVVAITPTRSGAWAVDVVGRSLRLDGGAWEPMPDRDRPRLFAIAQQREGQLLALSLPERYWRSDDDGDRWSPLDTAPVGALRLVTDRHGAVVADGSTGAWRLAPDGAMSRMTDAPIHAASLVVRPHRGPSARSVANGSATLVSDDYVEVVPTDDGWNLVRGRLGERLDVRPLRLERRCDRAVVATAHAHLWAACIEETDELSLIRLFYSPDRGGSLGEVAVVVSRLAERVSLVSDANGAVLVSAACPSHRPACRQGPLRVRPDGRFEPTVAPELRGPSFGLARGSRGQLYFLGERAKDRRVALFVSEDGERFVAQPFVPPRQYRGRWDRELTTRRTLHPGDDGAVGIAVHGTSPLYAVADPRGRITHVATLPEHTVAVGGHGQRILALTNVRSFELEAHLSNDGGRSFRPLDLPMTLEVSELDEPHVACGPAGCVIGDRITRIGWRVDDVTTPRLRPPELAALDVLPAIRTPISCSTSGNPVRLSDVANEPTLPSADAVMHGNVAWSVLRRVRGTGLVEVAAMTRSITSTSRLVRHRLLPPSQPRPRWATDVSIDRGGYAAVRAKLPPDRDAIAGAEMTLEVAWLPLQDATLRRSVVRDAGVFAEADVTPGRSPTLITGALALAPPGLLIRPSMARPEAWLLDGDGAVISRQQLPDSPATTALRTTLEVARLERAYFALQGLHLHASEHAATIAVAPLAGTTASASSTTVAIPALGRIFETHLSHRDGHPGIVSQTHGRDRDGLFAYFAPLLDTGRFGEPQPLPTQRDLGDTPTACRPDQRGVGLRLVAPYQRGTRHPVIVRDGNQRFALLTERAVIRATPDGPCLAGWVAVSIGQDPERLAIVSGDLEEAWLLRESEAATLEHLPMRCSFAPDVEIPEAVWREPGTITVSP